MLILTKYGIVSKYQQQISLWSLINYLSGLNFSWDIDFQISHYFGFQNQRYLRSQKLERKVLEVYKQDFKTMIMKS